MLPSPLVPAYVTPMPGPSVATRELPDRPWPAFGPRTMVAVSVGITK